MSHLVGPGYHSDFAVVGNTFRRQYQCKAENGTAVNLTGYTVKWRGVYGDTIIEKSTASGTLSMTTPSNGTITLTLTPTETRLIPVEQNMRYELELIAPDLTQQTVLWGDLVGKGGATSD
jgi:hypothetical protein